MPGRISGSRCPGLADLDDLLGRVRAAGLPVRYERSGAGPDLAPGLQLAVFRLIQEALTNTMKHGGPGASAAVRLQLTPAEVRVEVEDDGTGGTGGARRSRRRPDRDARAHQRVRR